MCIVTTINTAMELLQEIELETTMARGRLPAITARTPHFILPHPSFGPHIPSSFRFGVVRLDTVGKHVTSQTVRTYLDAR
jgi:hypothetical protein